MSAVSVSRPRRLAIFVTSVWLGVSLPLAEGCQDVCPDELVLAPSYRIFGGLSDWIKDSGRIEVTATAMTISYATRDGSAWEVQFMRTEQ